MNVTVLIMGGVGGEGFLKDLSLFLLIPWKFLLLEGCITMLLGGSNYGVVVGSLPGSQAFGVGVGRRNLLCRGGGFWGTAGLILVFRGRFWERFDLLEVVWDAVEEESGGGWRIGGNCGRAGAPCVWVRAAGC